MTALPAGAPAARASRHDEPALRGSRHPSLWRRTPNRADDFFDATTLAEARAYARPVNRVRTLGGVLGTAVAVAFVVGDAGPRLLDALDVDGWVLGVVVVALAFELTGLVFSPHLAAWSDLVHDRRHGLSTQTGLVFVADLLKQTLLSALLLGALLVPLFWVIRTFEVWWIGGWVLTSLLAAFFAFVYPVVVLPRFNRFDPLPAGDLRDRLFAVARRSGVTVREIVVMDASRRTRRDNAFVAGFGATKRIVLFDTLLEHPPEVVEQVVAHELGHDRLNHLPKSIAFNAVVLAAVFAFLGWFTENPTVLRWAGVDDVGDPGAVGLVLLGLGIGLKATGLATSWYSRAKERQADLEALEVLGRPDDFVELWRRLAPRNKSELEPSWRARLEHSHPEIPERMAFGLRWADMNAVGR